MGEKTLLFASGYFSCEEEEICWKESWNCFSANSVCFRFYVIFSSEMLDDSPFDSCLHCESFLE